MSNEYTSLTTIDGKTLDPEATFTYAEWLATRKPKPSFDLQSLEHGWLGEKLAEIKNRDRTDTVTWCASGHDAWKILNAIQTELTCCTEGGLRTEIEGFFDYLKAKVDADLRLAGRITP